MYEKDLDKLKCISVPDAARLCGIHKAFIYRAISRRDIDCVRLSRRRVVVPVLSLEKFLNERRIDAKDGEA